MAPRANWARAVLAWRATSWPGRAIKLNPPSTSGPDGLAQFLADKWQGRPKRSGRPALPPLLNPGEAEEEFARAGTARIIKTFLASRDPRPPCVPKEIGFGGSPNLHIALPSWLSEEDVNYYASKFDQKGFIGGLNYYRAMDLM
ncbi:Epoxide hydrolase 2 [Spatholobus suberectus]|nr:Epoxide hydrolase 2 [Spatholobus suberectus]